MRIEVWADVICPWCGLGDHRLRRALAQFEHSGKVDVVHRSFQLDPAAAEGVAVPSAVMLAAKGFDPDQIAATTGRLEHLAASEGLTPYRVAGAFAGSTALVHELLAHATSAGGGDTAWPRVYRAHFGEARDIFTVDGLVALAGDLGLDRSEARAALVDRRYRSQVVADQDRAARFGVRGVPFFLIDGQIALRGAQPSSTLLDAMRTAWSHAENAGEVRSSAPAR
jgi:predicted DsbA family dithiol-disulfide isomerase